MTLDELKTHCLSCTECELCKARTQVVFGVGNPAADILLIGEGPGENEDLQGQPFVGRSGKLLDQFLESIDLSREKNVYIANMVKCRPPKNRDPKPEEQEACLHWLREQFKIIRPRLVICVGRIAAQRLIDKDFGSPASTANLSTKTAPCLWALTTRPPFSATPITKKPPLATG